MTNLLIGVMGIIGDLLILTVLVTRRRVPRFPWFTLLMAFHCLGAIGLKAASHLARHEVSGLPAFVIEITDVLLQCAVFAELTWIALLPRADLRRLLLPLLLFAGGIFVVLSLAQAPHHSLREVLVLTHSLLAVLRLEWAIVLALMLWPLRLSWRSHVAAISFGFGVFSIHQLAAEGYFMPGSELSAYASSPFVRVPVYLLVLSWWSITLWLEEPGSSGTKRPLQSKSDGPL